MPAIEVENLSHSYNNKHALKEISVKIQEGDFIGLIGPNGSGKTTLIKNILGFLEPDNGDIQIFGKEVENFNDWDRIGYIPQRFKEDKQFPGTVRELLEADSAVTGSDSDVSSLNLEQFIGSKFTELSGGQKQRAMLALALQKDPDIIILDEPSLGVDADTQENFYNLVEDLNETGKTVILVTHDISVVSKYTDKVICINNTVCCQGSTENLEDQVEEVYGEKLRSSTTWVRTDAGDA